MICPRCGVINPDDADRCKRCRGSLARPSAPSEERAPAAATITTAPDPTPPSPEGRDQVPGDPAGPAAPPQPPPPSYAPPAYPPPSYAPPAPPAPPGPAGPRGPTGQQPGRPGWGQPPNTWSAPQAPPGGDWRARGPLPNYLPWAVLCTVLLFPIGGIVAIFYGVQVNRRTAAGDWAGASRASRLARTWCLICVAVGIVVTLLLISGAVHNPYKG